MATVSDVATPIASYHHGDFPLADLRAMKKDAADLGLHPGSRRAGDGRRHRRGVRRELVDAAGLVDELLVVDDRSEDGTAVVALRCWSPHRVGAEDRRAGSIGRWQG